MIYNFTTDITRQGMEEALNALDKLVGNHQPENDLLMRKFDLVKNLLEDLRRAESDTDFWLR